MVRPYTTYRAFRRNSARNQRAFMTKPVDRTVSAAMDRFFRIVPGPQGKPDYAATARRVLNLMPGA